MPTASDCTPARLTLNGQIYAAGAAALRRAEAAGEVIAGTFKQDRCGVRFYGRDGEPFAYAKLSTVEGWFVSCSRHDGRVRYMFALSDRDATRLGFDPAAPEACRREREAAADVRRQMAAIAQAHAA